MGDSICAVRTVMEIARWLVRRFIEQNRSMM
jgi:hypothetical protein